MPRRLAHALLAAALALGLMSGCEDRRSPVEQAVEWFPPSERARARCIVWYESRNNPAAVGGAGEASLFQIHPVHAGSFRRLTGKPWGEAWNPILNGQYAHRLWREQGWRPWTTAGRC